MGKRLFPVLIVVAVLFFVLYKGLVPETQIPATAPPTSTTSTSSKSSISQPEPQRPLAIDEKTQANKVADYLQQHARLTDFYNRKKEARDKGWNEKAGNLCDVLQGRAIGGDRFMNREKQLTEEVGRQWFEADVNYQCGHSG
ncbi:ribonuclease domain-containing protein, partial [Providencia stuartii]|uniref:ribonuclease domain-containing protein n=1 Tax=Providencia stuartii TaxID=588 RepID=UPI002FDAD121